MHVTIGRPRVVELASRRGSGPGRRRSPSRGSTVLDAAASGAQTALGAGLPDGGFWRELARHVATPAAPSVIIAVIAWVAVAAGLPAGKSMLVQIILIIAAFLLSILALVLVVFFWIRPPYDFGGGNSPNAPTRRPPSLPMGPSRSEYVRAIQSAEEGH